MKMSRFLSVVSAGMVALALTACGGGGGGSSASSGGTGGTGGSDTTFTIASTVVANGGNLPLEHACVRDGGLEIPPSFYWKNVPKDTGSFVINVEYIGQGDVPNYEHPVFRSLYNIDGNVLSIPASSDLTGLGANVVQGAKWTYNTSGVPCRHFKELSTPDPVQHFRVTILALSKDMPITLPAGTVQIDTITDASGVKVGNGLLDMIVVDTGDWATSKHVRDYVVGRASMTFDY